MKTKAPKESEVKNVLNSVSKLHVAHNNYVFALKEYNSTLDLFSKKLLPNAISSIQEIEEALLEET